jgi:uncharacterized protein involved in high-affinity Fe2+ transport
MFSPMSLRFMTYLRSSLLLLALGLLLQVSPVQAQEAVFGERVVDPGVKFTFLAAPKDDVAPAGQHLPENRTDIHLEVLAGWTEDISDEVGASAGAFVPYLHLFGHVTNQETGQTTKVSLVPHINQSDNAHYARNVSLPGAADDPYTVTFEVHPPQTFELAYHSDWQEAYGTPLFESFTVTYEDLQLSEVAQATRD